MKFIHRNTIDHICDNKFGAFNHNTKFRFDSNTNPLVCNALCLHVNKVPKFLRILTKTF